MTTGAGPAGRASGSILLPVIVVLLLIASAATAMTLQARTSLREAAVRRDRLRLGLMADGVARAAAQALAAAVASRKAPPFGVDGTTQVCMTPGGGRLALSAQDEGGLVDLNKGRRELILLVLQRSGISGWDAKAMTDAILQRRGDGGSMPPPGAQRLPGGRTTRPFSSVDELDRLPRMAAATFERLQPLFTVGSGASTIDPSVASPALRAVIAPKELSGPAMAAMVAPSPRSAYTVMAVALSRSGTRVARRSSLQIDPATMAARLKTWEAPVSFDPLPLSTADSFCRVMASLLGPA